MCAWLYQWGTRFWEDLHISSFVSARTTGCTDLATVSSGKKLDGLHVAQGVSTARAPWVPLHIASSRSGFGTFRWRLHLIGHDLEDFLHC